MEGQFGVFAGVLLLAEFDNDDDADEYRRDLLEENIPEYFRRSQYDACDLNVREIPEDPEEYAQLIRLLYELRASLKKDKEREKDATA